MILLLVAISVRQTIENRIFKSNYFLGRRWQSPMCKKNNVMFLAGIAGKRNLYYNCFLWILSVI
jgi:hypothetical protein